MSAESIQPSAGVDTPGEYDELAGEFVDLLERKHSIEQAVDGPVEEHPAYRGIVTELVDTATRMETALKDTLAEHEAETAYRKLV